MGRISTNAVKIKHYSFEMQLSVKIECLCVENPIVPINYSLQSRRVEEAWKITFSFDHLDQSYHIWLTPREYNDFRLWSDCPMLESNRLSGIASYLGGLSFSYTNPEKTRLRQILMQESRLIKEAELLHYDKEMLEKIVMLRHWVPTPDSRFLPDTIIIYIVAMTAFKGLYTASSADTTAFQQSEKLNASRLLNFIGNGRTQSSGSMKNVESNEDQGYTPFFK